MQGINTTNRHSVTNSEGIDNSTYKIQALRVNRKASHLASFSNNQSVTCHFTHILKSTVQTPLLYLTNDWCGTKINRYLNNSLGTVRLFLLVDNLLFVQSSVKMFCRMK